jgi:hypothetical protein
MYIKLKNGQVEKYPYHVAELKTDNPQVSFPKTISDSLFAEYEIFPVTTVSKPSVDHTKNIKEDTPQLINGAWTQVWSVTDATAEEKLARVLQLRKKEYPPMSEYLDGIVKGDVAQVEKYIADCLAVKAKYPKP